MPEVVDSNTGEVKLVDRLGQELHFDRRPTFTAVGKGRTKQSFKKECDINVIVKRAAETGVVTHLNKGLAQFGDFVSAPVDFQAAMDVVVRSEQLFMSLPSKVRDEFRNSPKLFLDFAQDPKNFDKMVEMGLAKAKPVDKPEVAPATPLPEGG